MAVSCGVIFFLALRAAGTSGALSFESGAASQSMRKAGWSGAMRRSSSSLASGPTPSKKAPTSHFHFSR